MNTRTFATLTAIALAGTLAFGQEQPEEKPSSDAILREQTDALKEQLAQTEEQIKAAKARADDWRPSGKPGMSPRNPAKPPSPYGGGGGGSSDAFASSSSDYGASSAMQAANTAITRVREMFNPPPRSLVVSVPARSDETLANLDEDLEVMSRILDKAAGRSIGQTQDPRYMGITIPGLNAGRTPQNFYIDGYGAMFILNVRFPLAAGEAKTNDATKRPNNSTWEQAKREVRGGGPVPQNNRSAEYSEEKVEALKKELIGELKNATNVRGLKPDEGITVVVTGDSGKEFSTETFRYRTIQGAPSTASRTESSDRSDRKTTMTLRVKKSDVDAFANGKMDAEDFPKKVMIAIY